MLLQRLRHQRAEMLLLAAVLLTLAVEPSHSAVAGSSSDHLSLLDKKASLHHTSNSAYAAATATGTAGSHAFTSGITIGTDVNSLVPAGAFGTTARTTAGAYGGAKHLPSTALKKGSTNHDGLHAEHDVAAAAAEMPLITTTRRVLPSQANADLALIASSDRTHHARHASLLPGRKTGRKGAVAVMDVSIPGGVEGRLARCCALVRKLG